MRIKRWFISRNHGDDNPQCSSLLEMLLWSGQVALYAWDFPSSWSLRVPFTSLLFYGSSGFVYSLVFMEHIHLWFIVERHIGGKLFEMHVSENNLIPPSQLIDGLDMEMWIGNQFPLELWRHNSVVFLLSCCCSQGWGHFLIFEHAHHCTTVKIQNYSIIAEISLMLPL